MVRYKVFFCKIHMATLCRWAGVGKHKLRIQVRSFNPSDIKKDLE